MSKKEVIKWDPRVAEISLPSSIRFEIEYNRDVIERLKADNKNLERRLASIKYLEAFRDELSLECPNQLNEKITILQCTERIRIHRCIRKNCVSRSMLLTKINI